MLKQSRRYWLGAGILMLVVFSGQTEIRDGCKAASGCTTVIIGKKATADGSVIMAHNEDYGANDCLHLVYHPGQNHAPGEVVSFAFEKVPQGATTYAYAAVEMYSGDRLGMPPAKFLDGMNEYGLCLGSNCIDCRGPTGPNNVGLGWPEIGQLVVERCKTAREAVELCGKLVDRYSFNGFEATSCKNLAFMIADPKEGWIMEVTRHHWVAKKCPDDGGIFYANQALITTDWDMASADLISFAESKGWFDQDSGKKFNFREAYGSELGKPMNVMREDRARELLIPKMGTVTVQDLTGVMMDHYEGKDWFDTPHSQKKSRPICVSGTQSTQIYHLRSNMPAALGCVMWSSAASPCLGVYAPIWAGHNEKTPAEWQEGKSTFSPESAWWTFENIQRILAPKNDPDPAFWKANWPVVRGRWDKIDKKGREQADALEREAMKLWQRGKVEEARRILTNYSNTRLHSDYLEARAILDLLKTKGRNPGQE